MMRQSFTMHDVSQRMGDFVREQDAKVIELLMYVGEQFINDAKNNGTYTDRTGNLRSSIGYRVIHRGQKLKEEIVEQTKDGKDGRKEARKTMDDVASKLSSEEFVLICVAGMEYAAEVESRGKDVITGSVPSAEAMLNRLKSQLRLR